MDIGDLAHIEVKKNNGKWSPKDGLYLAPFFGFIEELTKPKEKRKTRNLIGWTIYNSGAFVKLATIPLYIHMAQQTNDWSPFNFATYAVQQFSEKNIAENCPKKDLEKTFYMNSDKSVGMDY